MKKKIRILKLNILEYMILLLLLRCYATKSYYYESYFNIICWRFRLFLLLAVSFLSEIFTIMSSNIQISMLRPAKAEQTLNKSLLKDSKPTNIVQKPDKDATNEHFFTADTRAKILLTDISVDLKKKPREELQKVFDVYYKKLGKKKKVNLRKGNNKPKSQIQHLPEEPVSEPEPLLVPSDDLENKIDNHLQRSLSPVTVIDSRANSPTKGAFTFVHSPIYGPLKKVEIDPLTTEFRYIFKKYYKELPLYQPRVSKDRPVPSIEPATFSLNDEPIVETPKIRVSKYNYKETSKQKIHTVSKNFDESSGNIIKENGFTSLDERCYDIVPEDVIQRLIDILREFQSTSTKPTLAESSAIVAPIGTIAVPSTSRPVSAMNRNISSNISPLNNSCTTTGNIAGIETLFSKGKHLPRSASGKFGSSVTVFNSFDGSSSSGKLAPLLSAHTRPKSSENRKAVVQRAILTRTDPAKTWTIPEEYK